MKKKIVVCGGGSSAHTLIPFLNDSIFEVSILTSKPEQWKPEIELEWHDPDGNVLGEYKGKLSKSSNKASELIPEADYVIFCMPVHKYRDALLNEVGPYINRSKKEVFVGTVYGQAGFNWMVDEMKNKYSLTNIVTFAFELIPWICRIIKYGEKGVTYGCKAVNVAATYPNSYFEQVKEELFDVICYKWFGKGKTEQSDNFLSFTLSVDNQIIHTSRCFGLYKVYGTTWSRKEDVPMFYKDYDDISASLLKDLDDDYSKIRHALISKYPHKNYKYMLDYLALERLSYQSGNTDIKESFVTSKTLVSIGTPVVQNAEGKWEVDRNHRFFMDDIYYGNCIAKWIAEQLNIEVPTIDAIIHWVEGVRDEKLLDENNKLLIDGEDLAKPLKSGIPCYYGFKTIDDIID